MKGEKMCVSFSCGQHGLDYFTGLIRAVSKLGSLIQSDFVSNISARLLWRGYSFGLGKAALLAGPIMARFTLAS